MDIYNKDMKLKQIREQIELNKKNIIMTVGNIKINKDKNVSIMEIYKNIEIEQEKKNKEKKELSNAIGILVDNLEKSILEDNLPNHMIEKLIKEKNRLLKILIE